MAGGLRHRGPGAGERQSRSIDALEELQEDQADGISLGQQMVAARAGQLFDKAFHAEKSGRPYLDGIEFTIISDMSTANLAFIAGSDNGQGSRGTQDT